MESDTKLMYLLEKLFYLEKGLRELFIGQPKV